VVLLLPAAAETRTEAKPGEKVDGYNPSRPSVLSLHTDAG